MTNTIASIGGCFSPLLKNTHLNFNLQGWPAAVTLISVATCVTGVTAFAIWEYYHNDSNNERKEPLLSYEKFRNSNNWNNWSEKI